MLIITSEESITEALVSGFIFPVITETEVPASISEKNPLCWSVRGFVGARTRTFPYERYSAAILSATTVLPSPVGSMTRVLHLRQPSTMFVWYALSSTFPGRMRG